MLHLNCKMLQESISLSPQPPASSLISFSNSSLASASNWRSLKCRGVLRPLNTLIGPACGMSTIRSLFLVHCVFRLVIQCPVDNWQHTPGDFVCPVCLPQSSEILGIELGRMCLGFPFFHVDIYAYSIAYVKRQPWGQGQGRGKMVFIYPFF